MSNPTFLLAKSGNPTQWPYFAFPKKPDLHQIRLATTLGNIRKNYLSSQ